MPDDKPAEAGKYWVVLHDGVGGSTLGWTKGLVVRPDDQWTDVPASQLSPANYKRLVQLGALREATGDEAKAADQAAKDAEKAQEIFSGYSIPPEPEPEGETVSAVVEEPTAPAAAPPPPTRSRSQ